MRRLSISLLLLGILGCSSQLGTGRARTLDRGRSHIGMGLQFDLLSNKNGEDTNANIPWSQMTVGYHRGITDEFELGGRVWGLTIPTLLTTAGLGLDAKVALIRPKGDSHSLNLSVGALLGYQSAWIGGPPFHVWSFCIPGYLGIPLGRHELTFTPRVSEFIIAGYGMNTLSAFYFGSGVGFAIRVKEVVDLTPELVLMYNPTLSFNGEAQDTERVGVTMFQLGFGIHWQGI